MSSYVSGDSVFSDGTPISSSPYVVENSDTGLNIDTRGTEMGVNLQIEGDAPDVVYSSDKTDLIATGGGNDIVNAGGDDDFVDGGDGDDILRGGDGDDFIKGGKGADVLIGGKGADVFLIQGDPVDGAFGVDSDLQFDPNSQDPGEFLIDHILDFNDHEDVLVLQDLQVEGIGTVDYNPNTGDVTLTDDAAPDVTRVIAKLQPGLDITEVDQGDGNWTLL